MRRPRVATLRARLVVAFAGVGLVALGALAVAVRLFDPFFLGVHPLGARRGGATRGLTHAAFYDALNAAILVALGIGLVVAVLVGRLAAARILRPLDAVRKATRLLAAGRYGERVAPPRAPELAALAEDVNHLGEALAATERQRARLIGDLAHELRTPITVLRGLLEGSLDGVLTLDDTLLGSALEETARLERLAGDLAEMSRADEGALELRLKVVDLSALAERVVARLRPQFEEKQVRLEVRAPEALLVQADPDRVVQVVTNLLGNALRATPEGGTVAVETAAEGGAARLEVRDDGVGIATEHLDKVFERFWRSPAPGGPGSGVGLTIARAIAVAHGGALTVDSAGLGQGAAFTLSLPVAPAR